MFNTLRNIYIGLLSLAVLVALSLFTYSYLQYVPKWDIMNYHYPLSSYVGDALKLYQLPLWCSYSSLGLPVYADPSSGFWYPVNMFLMWLWGFDIHVLQVEYLLHLILAAIGMYKLLITLTANRYAALTIAFIFPFTGLFISNASHNSFVYSMAWLPFVFHYFIQGYRRQKYLYFILCGTALALCALGGYIVFPIIACYVLGAMFIYYLAKQKDAKNRLLVTWFASVAAFTFFLLCSGFIFSLVLSLPYQVRADALSLQAVQTNPFTPRCMLSFLLPFSTTANVGFFDTDITMRNAYIGLCTLPLIAIGILYGKKRSNLSLFLSGIFFLLASFGEHVPVREWLYHTLPFMKMFRHPAIFRAGTILCFLVIAADGLRIIYTNENPVIKRIFLLVTGLEIVAISIFFGIAVAQQGLHTAFPNFLSPSSVNTFNEQGNMWANIITQCTLQICFLALCLVACFSWSGRKLGRSISLLLALDVLAAAGMNSAGTIISDTPANKFAEEAAKLPSDFPLDMKSSVSTYNVYAGPELAPMVYNANLLRKQVCTETFNPFTLKSFVQFNKSGLYKYTVQQPVVFTTIIIKPYKEYITDSIQGKISRSSLYADIANVIVRPDSAVVKVGLTNSFSNLIALSTEGDKPSFLTLLQCYYPGWSVTIDGKPEEIIQSNYAFMSIPLPAGKHTVEFSFQPPAIIGLVIFQCIVWVVLALYIIAAVFKNRLSL